MGATLHKGGAPMECITCNSKEIISYGYYKTYRKFKCNNCGKQFSERSLSPFCRHRFPDDVIKNSILYGLFVSTRNVVFIAKETMNFIFSHQTSYNWSKKFAKLLNKLVKNLPKINASHIWHVDEKFIKIGRKTAYLWAVIDTNNNMLAVHVSLKRDGESAKHVLELAKKNTGIIPRFLISDGLQGYKKAVKKTFGRKTRHVIAHFEAKGIVHKGKLMKLSNNRAERINEFYALWLHSVRGFKRLDRANLLIEFFTLYYNYLMPHGIEEEVKVQWEKVPVLINS